MSGAARARLLIPILLAVLAEISLLCLGSWQIYRLQFKNSLIANINTQMQLTPLESIDHKSAYRQVKLRGRYLADKSMRLYALNGKGEPGYDALVPLQMSDAAVVLVRNSRHCEELASAAIQPKGKNKKDEASCRYASRNNEVVEGVAMPISPKGIFTPANEPQNNLWYYINAKEMGEYAKKELLPFVLVTKTDAQRFRDNIRNDHLGYALLWYSLAVAAALMFWWRNKQ